MTGPTHVELVAFAGRWLSSTRRCVLVLEEMQCWVANEFPDAIGWTFAEGYGAGAYSILVECKTSRSDFHADKAKPSKHSGVETAGRERWYLTPPGLLKPEDLPPGYGLLELRGTRVRRVHDASTEERPGRQDAEIPFLLSAARREAWSAGWQGRQVRLACGQGASEPLQCDHPRKLREPFKGKGEWLWWCRRCGARACALGVERPTHVIKIESEAASG